VGVVVGYAMGATAIAEMLGDDTILDTVDATRRKVEKVKGAAVR
jgi:hypothetical protein